MNNKKRYESFEEFFPFYLSEHSDAVNRGFHYAGTLAVVFAFFYGVFTLNFWLLIALPVIGYGSAWFGHFIIEKNTPATFKYPGWSLIGDFKMLGLFLTGRLKNHMPTSEWDAS